MKRVSYVLFIVLLVSLASGAVLAQSYPSRPVRIVIPMTAGGQMDAVARLIAQKLTENWKEPALIENRGGSGGNVGANAVAKSEPNGYTFLMASSGIAISPSIYRKLPFDPLKDLIPVSQIYSSSLLLVVNPSVPANTVPELIALAKAQPGRLNYASTGTGGNPHLAAELFKSMTRTDIVHVPYKGASQTDSAVAANEVQVLFAIQHGVMPLVKSGRLRALGVTAKARLATLPDVPTVAEAGVPDYEFRTWVGMFSPAGTPRQIVDRIHADVAKVLATPDVRERIINMGNEPAGTTQEEFETMFKTDVARYSRIVKDARIPLQD